MKLIRYTIIGLIAITLITIFLLLCLSPVMIPRMVWPDWSVANSTILVFIMLGWSGILTGTTWYLLEEVIRA